MVRFVQRVGIFHPPGWALTRAHGRLPGIEFKQIPQRLVRGTQMGAAGWAALTLIDLIFALVAMLR